MFRYIVAVKAYDVAQRRYGEVWVHQLRIFGDSRGPMTAHMRDVGFEVLKGLHSSEAAAREAAEFFLLAREEGDIKVVSSLWNEQVDLA